MEPTLVTPSVVYKKSFLEALAEYHAEGRHMDRNAQELKEHFDEWLAEVDRESKGINLREGRVPQSIFWLVLDEEFLGEVRIRHKLNEHLEKVGGHIGYDVRPSQRHKGYGTLLLALALPKARELGIGAVLLTCDATNVASRKIIEHAGGVFESEIEVEAGTPNKQRFWIGK